MVLFLVFSALVANPNNYFTPGQSRSWSTDQGKKEIEKVYQCPPPPRCSFGGNNQKITPRIYMRLGATQVSFRLAPAQRFLRLVDWANWCRFGRFYASVCDDNFTSLSALSLLLAMSRRPSISSFLHAAMNLRPPSATVSTHTSAYNAVAFHPAMPNARMSFYLGGGAG